MKNSSAYILSLFCFLVLSDYRLLKIWTINTGDSITLGVNNSMLVIISTYVVDVDNTRLLQLVSCNK